MITRRLVDWTRTVLPAAAVTARSLHDASRDDGVEFRLLGLTPRPAPRGPAAPAMLALDYLVTLRLADPLAEQAGLAELLFAAMDEADFEVIEGRNAAELCAELGLPVAPGFILRTLLVRTRPARKVALVREPLVVHAAELGVIEGTVLGPGDVPIAGAVVTARDLARSTRTDGAGRFRLIGPPNGGRTTRLHARARGVETEAEAASGQSVILRLPVEI